LKPGSVDEMLVKPVFKGQYKMPIARDMAILQDLAPNSWWQLHSAYPKIVYVIPDLWLADRAISFYPAVMDYMRQNEPVAYKGQRDHDVYNFCAKLTVMPGEMWLPMERSATLLCSVWKHQLSGMALHVSVTAAGLPEFPKEALRILRQHAVFHSRFFKPENSELHLDDLHRRMGMQTSEAQWEDVAMLAVHAGVSLTMRPADATVRCAIRLLMRVWLLLCVPHADGDAACVDPAGCSAHGAGCDGRRAGGVRRGGRRSHLLRGLLRGADGVHELAHLRRDSAAAARRHQGALAVDAPAAGHAEP
jgi:hypothetical protein